MKSENIGVVIATRNRESYLDKLLNSIKVNSKLPKIICIVASGRQINGVIEKYKQILPIRYIHMDQKGQVKQRNTGIRSIQNEVDIICNLDDDHVLDKEFFNLCLKDFKSVSSSVVGMGTNQKNRFFKNQKCNLIKRIYLQCSDKNGIILKSGKATQYNQNSKFEKTEWLNGLSVWRSEIFSEYINELEVSQYAAAEDIIFSYQVSRKYELVTNGDLVLYEQEINQQIDENFERLVATNLHRLYMVEKFNNLSRVAYGFNLIGITIEHLIRDKRDRDKPTFQRFKANIFSLKFFIQYLLLNFLKKADKEWLLSR